MNYRIITFDNTNITQLPHPEEPFDVIGRLVPIYDGYHWSTSEHFYEQREEKTYPNDSFDPAQYVDNPSEVAFLAMHGNERVGSIRVCKRWNGNGFIDDLKVNRAHRGNGVGKMLMDAAVKWSKEKKLNGLSLETQDNNLLACRFYLKYGFVLGGIDTRVYTHPLYKGETALYFYLSEELYQAK